MLASDRSVTDPMAETSAINRRAPLRLPTILLLLVLVVLAVAFGAAPWIAELYLLDGSQGFPLDDSWIHLAFARNLATGGGLSINPGELVAGTTGPLWTALVSLGVLLPLDDLVWMKLLGLAHFLGGVALVLALARRLGLGGGLSAFAAVLTLGTGWLAWSALSGMEISLFVFLSLAGILLHLRERDDPARPPLSLAVFGLAALARPEGLGLVVAASVDRALRCRRLREERWPSSARSPFPAAARGGSRPGGSGRRAGRRFFVWIGGSPLPTTLAARTGGPGSTCRRPTTFRSPPASCCGASPGSLCSLPPGRSSWSDGSARPGTGGCCLPSGSSLSRWPTRV